MKFDLIDWISVLIGTTLTCFMFMLDCLFLYYPVKWLLVQLFFVIAPATYAVECLIREKVAKR